MDYLVVEGYKSAAEEFSRETGIPSAVELATIESRMCIREAVQRGDVEEAIERVNDLNPEILDSNPGLYFHLQQQRLIEHIRHGRVVEALSFAQSELAPRGEENPEYLSELERTMALLAFDIDGPNVPPMIVELMGQNQRQKTAGELNAAILESLSQGKESKLVGLVRLMCWGEAMLEKRADFPHADLQSGLKLALYIKAELENVTSLEPASDDFEWFFKEKHDLATGHDTANFVWKCGSCKRESSAKFDKFDNKSPHTKPYELSSSEKQEFSPLVVIECRGLEFMDFDPVGIWKCVGAESGTKFTEVDLGDGEWTDYDEKHCSPPENVPGYVVTEQIRKAAHAFGSVTVFKAYLELSAVGITKEMIDLRSELQSSGVSLTDCPRMDRKDVVDKMMLVDMLAFALDNPAPAVVMLISGDRDFVYAVSILHHRRYTVVVVTSAEGSYITLTSQANIVLDWKYDIFANNADPSETQFPAPDFTRSSFSPRDWGLENIHRPGKIIRPNIKRSRSPSSMTLDPTAEKEGVGTPQVVHNKDVRLSTPLPDIDLLASSRKNRASSVQGGQVGDTLSESSDKNLSDTTSASNEVIPSIEVGAIAPPMDHIISLQSPPFSPKPTSVGSTLPPTTAISPIPPPSCEGPPVLDAVVGDCAVSPTDPSRKFRNLIEVLERLRLMGKEQPRWSVVAGDLHSNNPLLYQRVGVRGFKQYVTLAEQAKIVITNISEGSGKEWIALTDTYKGKVFPVYTET
ncbi:hypothetical protein FRB96_006338 [Tulasnella sp. 330]|nr:hypothetical protein FRB96_006338 [Tulasnella sp. 330]